MPSNDQFSERLTQAGQRAAGRSGATPPPLDTIRVEVARRQRGQRTLTGVVASLALIAIIPVAAFFFTQGDDAGVVTAASNAEAAVSQATSQDTTTTTEATASPLVDDLDSADAQDLDLDFGGDLDENVDVQIEIGDRSYSLEVIVDDSAVSRAADAEAAAEDTRVIGDNTVWLRGLNGQSEASALVDDGVFAVATGPTEEVIDALDELGELADAASSFFDGETGLDGLLGDGGLPFDPEEFFGPDGNFEQFFGEDFNPEEFLGTDSDLNQFFDEDFDIDEFFDGELPFDLDGLEEGDLNLGDLFGQLEDLQECFGPAFEDAEATGTFTLPDCEIEELTTT